MLPRNHGLARTTLRMFSDMKQRRIDLSILLVFAAILFLTADRLVGALLALCSQDFADRYLSWRPGLRGTGMGAFAALLMLALFLCPFWRETRRRLQSEIPPQQTPER